MPKDTYACMPVLPQSELTQLVRSEAPLSRVWVSDSPLFWRRALGFLGPGFLISVGYMDPGNWATDIAGGSKYGYTLLYVVMLSNLVAILLQSLALKFGVATERDLAQACRETYSRRTTIFLWVFAEVAIAACDLAEVVGSAVMEGFLHIKLNPWLRRLITRLLAIIPTVIVVLNLWGKGNRKPVDSEPSDPEHAAQFRRLPSR